MQKGFLFLSFIILSCHLRSQNLELVDLKNYTYSLELRKDGKMLGYGSGFIMEKNRNFYLVTCYHVLTGKDPISNSLLPQIKESPDQVVILFRSKTGLKVKAPYYLQHGNKDAFLYIPHADIAVMPLYDLDVAKLNIYSINVNDMEDGIFNNDKVILCGFPGNNPDMNIMPTVYIAFITKQPTERDLDFCMDTSIPEGVSGGPIYKANPGKGIQLIGVYSLTPVSNNICKAAGVSVTVLRNILSFLRK